jgi:heme oxygenase
MDTIDLDSRREVTSSDSAPLMTEPRSMIDLLRAQTATHHQRLESGLQIEKRLSDGETRGPLIAGYLAFHRETEMALRPHLWGTPDLAFSSRVRFRRTSSKAELPSRGTRSGSQVFPAIGTKAEALGAFYVLEGSTLGGKRILKALNSQGVPTDDLHFLDPYGKDAGAYWRTFLIVLERETAHHRSTMDACVSGAIKTFAFAETCLREERKN